MKTNRKLILGTLAVLLVSSLPALRADDAGTPPPPPAHGKGEGRGPGQRLQMLAEKLNLTADQKAKIEPLVKAEIDEIKVVMDDQSLTREARREKMMAINQKYRPQIAAFLTPEQQAKFKEIRQERREHRQGDAPAKKE
jgi:Spy/CpxP family protein refolding chaperone